MEKSHYILPRGGARIRYSRYTAKVNVVCLQSAFHQQNDDVKNCMQIPYRSKNMPEAAAAQSQITPRQGNNKRGEGRRLIWNFAQAQVAWGVVSCGRFFRISGLGLDPDSQSAVSPN